MAYALNQATDQGNVFCQRPNSRSRRPNCSAFRWSRRAWASSPSGTTTRSRWWMRRAATTCRHPRWDGVPATEFPNSSPRPARFYAASTVEQAQHLVQEEHAVYLTPFFFSEKGVAGRLLRIAYEGEPSGRLPAGALQLGRKLATLERTNGLALAAKQRQAVQKSR
ncbi:MAG: hypothetical protein R2838_23030 [Caldilineaceae bacterium]